MPKVSREYRKVKLRAALTEKLKQENKTQEYWYDLVLDYLAFWEIKEKLKTEIERNGPMVKIENGSQKFRKRNDAVVELPKIHKRMTEILEMLNAKQEEIDDDDDF